MKRKISTSHDYHAESFDKCYQFVSNHQWRLPRGVFKENHWQISGLQGKKHELNAIKEQLSVYDIATWSMHTKKRDASTQIIKTIRKSYNPELLTQAWCKFYEMLSRLNLLNETALRRRQVNSVHLCEAPGGFISALNHYLITTNHNVKLCWNANTLNPSYEGNPTSCMIPDDRLIAFTKDAWLFGADHTGDITKFYNYKSITERILEQHPEKVDLVTADGSVDCMYDPGNQEAHVEHLHYCEVITALTVLQTGGSFVLKIFTTFEHSTISLLYLLNLVFATVCIIKPITSKSGNSETYVVCQAYRGSSMLSVIWSQLLDHYAQPSATKSLFSLLDLPGDFLAQIDACAAYFMRLQISTISENIRHFGQDSKEYNYRLYKHNNAIVHKFLAQFPIHHISGEQHIVPQCELNRFWASAIKTKSQTSSMQLFKCYCHASHSSRGVNVNFVFGKRIEKVAYTKFARVQELELRDEKINIFTDSLFERCKTSLCAACVLIDCSNVAEAQYQVHREVLRRVLHIFAEESSANVLLINVRLISNFLVGLLFILSQSFQIYFFKHGLIYLVRTPNSCNDAKRSCIAINEALRNLPNCIDFDIDLLAVVDECDYDNAFINCIHFYNSHFT